MRLILKLIAKTSSRVVEEKMVQMSKTLDKLFETYAYDSRQKTQLRLADEKGLDISKMKDPKFNWEQMREIS